MLRKVVGEAHEALEGASSSLGTPSHSHGNRARTSSLASVDTTSSAQHHTTVHTPGSGGGHRSQNGAHSPSHSIAWGMGGVLDTNNANGSKTTLYTVPGAPESTVVRPDFPVNLEAADLKLLLQKRPELVEFLHLEIEQMKLETERLTNME